MRLETCEKSNVSFFKNIYTLQAKKFHFLWRFDNTKKVLLRYITCILIIEETSS